MRASIGRWLERDSTLARLLTIPSAIWILGIVGYPILLVIWMSVHQQATVETDAPFVGLENYLRVLQWPAFWEAAWRTTVWTASNLLLIVPIGVAIALLLNRRFVGQRFARTWMLLPWMFPIVVTILMWRWILDPVAGVMNYLLVNFHIIDSPLSFFGQGRLAMLTVILVNVWRWTPFMAVVTLAALQTVPSDLYDAARVDGATASQMFWQITLPLIIPTLASTGFILVLWLFNMFPPIWLMTQGGPVDATTTLPIQIYQQGMQQFRMSNAATISVLLLILFVLPLAILYFNTFGREREASVEAPEKL